MIFVFYILTFFEAFVISIIIKKAFRLSTNSKDIIFDPFILFSIFWFILYGIVPVMMITGNAYKYEDSYSDITIVITKAQTVLFYMITALLYGYFLWVATKNTRFPKRKEKMIVKMKNLSKWQKIILTFFLIIVLVITFNFLSYVLSFDLADYYKNRIILRKGMGATILTIYTSNMLLLIFFVNRFVSKKKYSKLVNWMKNFMLFLTISLFTVAYVVMGNRLTALLLLLSIFMVYIYLKPRISRKFVVRTMIFTLVLTILFSLAGFIRIRVNNDDVYKQFFSSLYEKIEDNVVTSFGKYENMLWLNENFENWNMLYGKTYAAGFTNVIPRNLWPNKWLGGGPELKNMIMPGSYDLNAKKITSYTTGLPTEAYMNFSFLGFLIIPFVYAFGLFLMKKMERSLNGNIINLAIYIYLIISVCFILLYGEFLGIFSRTLFVLSPFILINYFSKFKYVWKK